ncbi:MAG: hypothetical protein CL758_05035 [Chloroflexi bacterium]|nr:hypothetical protein [Chloroflexota bacterium]|tara:strand:+ start:2489 stop:2842 length:354 start_codon:yes stop_codon:yes gene_type:complete
MIKNIGGINISTDNFQQMSNFYKNILKLNVHSSKTNWISFEYLDFRLNITTHKMVSNINHDQYRIMINFITDNIDQMYKTLLNKDVEFIRKPEKEKWGGCVATFYDPDRNILQLLQK